MPRSQPPLGELPRALALRARLALRPRPCPSSRRHHRIGRARAAQLPSSSTCHELMSAASPVPPACRPRRSTSPRCPWRPPACFAAQHLVRVAPRVLGVLAVHVLVEVLELVGAALVGVRLRPLGNASYAYFFTVSCAMSSFDSPNMLHDARTDDEAHDEREDREHDHDLEQGHAALGSARGRWRACSSLRS